MSKENETPTVRNPVEAVVSVRCIGVDNRQHECEPHKDTCLCGVKVKRKKPLRDDYKLFSCYECTY